VSANKGYTLSDYVETYKRTGSKKATARHLGVHASTVQEQLKRAATLDPALMEAAKAVRTDLVPVSVWAKTAPDETGMAYSVLLKPPPVDPVAISDVIRGALADLPPAPHVAPPQHVSADLLTLLPIADAHIGLMAWAPESGRDWNTRLGAERVVAWSQSALAAAQPSGTCVILVAGDYLHADNQSNETPTSRHRLDVDTRHFKTLDVAIQSLATTAGIALASHERVIIRVLRGNHDPNAADAVQLALAAYYRDEPRITVQTSPNDFWVHLFGKVMLAAHHGHRAKARELVLFLAAQYAPMWGRSTHRYLFTGHLHHHKAQDIGGVEWHQLPALSQQDAYGFGGAWVQRPRMHAMTYHRQHGEIMRVTVRAPD